MLKSHEITRQVQFLSGLETEHFSENNRNQIANIDICYFTTMKLLASQWHWGRDIKCTHFENVILVVLNQYFFFLNVIQTLKTD